MGHKINFCEPHNTPVRSLTIKRELNPVADRGHKREGTPLFYNPWLDQYISSILFRETLKASSRNNHGLREGQFAHCRMREGASHRVGSTEK